MRQWVYRHLPDTVRSALRPPYYQIRYWRERLQLRRVWQRSRQASKPSFFPALSGYALSTRVYSKRRATRAQSFVPIPDETAFHPPAPKTSGYNPLVHLVIPNNPPLFAAQLHDVRIFGDAGDVITGDNVLLADLSFRTPVRMAHERNEHPLLEQNPLLPTSAQRGTYARLTSLYGGSNYFHWMFNVLPRLALLERAGVTDDSVDGYLVNRLTLPVMSEMLRLVQISDARCIQMDTHTALRVEHVWVTPSLMTTGHRRRSIGNWLRSHFLPTAAGKPDRRIYLSRADASTRRMANETELLDILEPLGFEKIVIGARSISEQALLFAQADIVIAPHSAALANLVFCSPGTRVLDLMQANRVRTYYWELSACMGLDYYYAFTSQDPKPLPARLRGYDTILPINDLRAMLKRMAIA